MSRNWSDFTDEELIKLARELHESVDNDCTSVGDFVALSGAISQLEARGYSISYKTVIVVEKEEDDE